MTVDSNADSAQPRARGLPAVTFGIIVLNGEPFTRYNLRSLYPIAHEIIVAEGASPHASAMATADGHSNDGTLDVLRQFQAEEDPEGKVIVVTAEDEGHPDGIWPGEKEEQSRAYAKRATGDYLWQIDIDEFYQPEEMQRLLTYLEANPEVSGASFAWHNFWGGFDYVVDGWAYRRQMEQMNGIRRLFRWGNGYRYVAHRPPTVADEAGRDLCTRRWLGPDATAAMGIYCYHYGMVFPLQAYQKTLYYRNMWDSHRDMEAWHRESYNSLRRPYRILHAMPAPTWLQSYQGDHPPQIQRLQDDIKVGRINIEMRPTDDIEELVQKRSYRLSVTLLDRWYKIKEASKKRGRELIELASRTFYRLCRIPTSPRTTVLIGEAGFRLAKRRRKKMDVHLNRVQQVLVAQFESAADVIEGSAFLRELRRNAPQAEITLIVHPSLVGLVEDCPYVDHVVPSAAPSEGRFWKVRTYGYAFQLASRKLWSRHFDLAIVPRWDENYWQALYVAYFSGAAARVGFSEEVSAKRHLPNRRLDRLLTHTLEEKPERDNGAEGLKLIRFVGGSVRETTSELWTTAQDKVFVEHLLRRHGVPPKAPLIALGIGAHDPKRRWSVDRLAALGTLLEERLCVRLVIIGSIEEKAVANALMQRLGETAIDLVGEMTLRQTGVLLGRCRFFVGSESTESRLAAAAGAPVIDVSPNLENSVKIQHDAATRGGSEDVSWRSTQPEGATEWCVRLEEGIADSSHYASLQQLLNIVEEIARSDRI